MTDLDNHHQFIAHLAECVRAISERDPFVPIRAETTRIERSTITPRSLIGMLSGEISRLAAWLDEPITEL